MGGVQELDFEAGGEILFNVTSNTDASSTSTAMTSSRASRRATRPPSTSPADIEGVFELEEHDLGTPLAEITVSPG